MDAIRFGYLSDGLVAFQELHHHLKFESGRVSLGHRNLLIHIIVEVPEAVKSHKWGQCNFSRSVPLLPKRPIPKASIDALDSAKEVVKEIRDAHTRESRYKVINF
jgi:hypothetical protein